MAILTAASARRVVTALAFAAAAALAADVSVSVLTDDFPLG